ncbi:chemotaxis-specific protein-glutamate methyltransferase CheB [Virgibacillus sp. W0181]|uniref:chemotaxis-specific protein-glutamate methyltransferase CheB n=1 Tax=Virgibacillus sp. W0181 TaxID=3391581 RepID=UPI003F447FA9
MHRIRIAVIDESNPTRKAIEAIVNNDSQMVLVVSSYNRNQGLSAVENSSVDIILLSVEMPVLDGVTTIEALMRISSAPIVILAKSTVESTAKTVRAISNGAVDFIRLPKETTDLTSEVFKEQVIKKIQSAAHARAGRISKLNKEQKAAPEINIDIQKEQKYEQTIIAIGASTGGPRALQQILLDLPNDFDASILIVQHMPAGFTRSLAERLNRIASITVKEAVDGETIQTRTAYIAPGNYHMKLVKNNGFKIKLTQEKERLGHRPSVNVLFDSLALIANINIMAVVLTGMGKDGAEGIEQIKKKNKKAIIITESIESSVVYGMPAAAVQTTLVNESLHLRNIGKVIAKFDRVSGGM